MKTVKNHRKWISIILCFTVIFQSCRAYYKKPASLEQAVETQKRVRIETHDKRILRFKQVIYEDGKFYGLKMVNGQLERTEISPNNLKGVRLHNKGKSIVLGILTPIIVVGSILFIGLSTANWGPSGNFNWQW